MSAIGVLSMKHEQAAAMLLAQSLNFDLLMEAANEDPDELVKDDVELN